MTGWDFMQLTAIVGAFLIGYVVRGVQARRADRRVIQMLNQTLADIKTARQR